MWVEVAATVAVLLVTRWLWRRFKYDLHKIPSPPSLPLLGHSVDFIFGRAGKQMAQWLKSSFKNLGNPKLMRVDIMGQIWLFVADMEFIKSTMLSKTNSFNKMTAPDALLELTCGCRKKLKFLIPEESVTPYVLKVRKMYLTAFLSSNLKAAMPKIQGVMQNLFSVIEATRTEGAIDVQELSVKMTLDTIGQMAFYSNLGGLDGSRRIHELIRSVGDIGLQRLFNPLKKAQSILFPHSKEIQRQESDIKALGDEWDRLMAEIDAKEDPPEGVEPIWYSMKHLEDPDTGKPIDRDSRRCEIASVVVAGMDTTGHQLAWTLALLGSYPLVTDKLVKELVQHELCGTDMRAIAFDDFAELTYLSAVVKEGLRLAHIVALGAPRIVPKDMTIVGYRVPKGTVVASPGNTEYSTEADWGDPDVFRPERWLAGDNMSQKYFLPFSVGPRDCPGQRLALLELRLSIAEIVRRYELRLEGTFEDLITKAKGHAIATAPDGIWMHFTPRVTSA